MPYKHYGGWRARWLDENGKQRSKTFEHRKDAAYYEQKMKAEVVEIAAGMRSPTPAPWTFTQLADKWLTTRALAKRSKKDDESILKRHLLPAFGALPIREIDVERAEAFKAERAHLSKKTVANHLTLLIAMLNYARALRWLIEVPEIKKPRVRMHSKDFMFLRTTADVRRFLGAAKEESEGAFAMYATAVYIGARAGELAALRWDDVDLEQRLITIQRSYDGPTKGDDVHYAPILDPLLPILRAWRLRNPLPLVFPNQAGAMYGESSQVFQEVLHRVLDRAGLPLRRARGKQAPRHRGGRFSSAGGPARSARSREAGNGDNTGSGRVPLRDPLGSDRSVAALRRVRLRREVLALTERRSSGPQEPSRAISNPLPASPGRTRRRVGDDALTRSRPATGARIDTRSVLAEQLHRRSRGRHWHDDLQEPLNACPRSSRLGLHLRHEAMHEHEVRLDSAEVVECDQVSGHAIVILGQKTRPVRPVAPNTTKSIRPPFLSRLARSPTSVALPDGPPTIDHQHVARDVCGRVRREEDRGAHHVRRLADAAEWGA